MINYMHSMCMNNSVSSNERRCLLYPLLTKRQLFNLILLLYLHNGKLLVNRCYANMLIFPSVFLSYNYVQISSLFPCRSRLWISLPAKCLLCCIIYMVIWRINKDLLFLSSFWSAFLCAFHCCLFFFVSWIIVAAQPFEEWISIF